MNVGFKMNNTQQLKQSLFNLIMTNWIPCKVGVLKP